METADLSGRLELLEDPDLAFDPPDALAAGNLPTIASTAPNFGYTRSRFWLRLDIENATEDIAEWRIVLNDDYLEEFAVYLSREGSELETLVALDAASPFSARPVPFRLLVAPMRFEPGARGTLLVRYRSDGLSAPNLRIETVDSFSDFVSERATRNALFYGATTVLIIIALVGLIVTRRFVFAAYAAYAASITAHILVMDGVALQEVWPNHPQLSGTLPSYIGLAIFLSAAAFARSFLQTRALHPRLDLIWRGIIAVMLVLLVCAPFADPMLFNGILVQLSSVVALMMVVSGLVAARTRFREVRFFLAAWAGAFIAAGIGAGRHALGFEMTRDVQNDVQRFWLVFDALLMGFAIADRYYQERLAAQASMDQALMQSRRNLVLSERLGTLEAAYEAVRANARHRSERVQDAVHDMRQPLAALRLKVRSVVRDNPASDRDLAEIERSFGYVEQLVSDQGLTVEREPRGGPDDAVGLGQILQAVGAMFGPDAAKARADLVVVPTSLSVATPSLVVMRCLSNLVSNAIKYAPGGRILVGARRTEHTVRIEIHDTGPGLSRAAFDQALQRSVRLVGPEAAAGEGFGLAIVADHARSHGFTLRWLPPRAGGLSVALELPRSDRLG